jgi:hypothetical protein
VTHTCDLSYSGGRDQEDHSLKPAPVNSSQDPILKKIQHKKELVEWHRKLHLCTMVLVETRVRRASGLTMPLFSRDLKDKQLLD